MARKTKKPNLHTDGLVNVASGLGTQRSKRAHNTFEYEQFTNWPQLDAAYQSNWLARQIVDIPAEDACREWRTIKTDGADDIRREEDRLMVPMQVQEALSWARLYGGAGVLMITGQDLTQPLDVNRIRKGGLQRVIPFDRFDMQAMTLNTWNVLAPNYLLPEYYTISTANGQEIHWSHFARFNGARLPRRQMAVTQGWGDSELRKCLADIMDTVASKDGIAELMQEANIDVIKRAGLNEELASDQDDLITDRYALFGQMKSLVKLALLDGDETLERMTLNLGGVADVLKVMMTWISGAADIPVTRLFGMSAQGLNNTGEGDLKNYYNSIRSKQLVQLDPGMRTLDEVLVRSALGYFPDDFNYVWNPLSTSDPLQAAQAGAATAQRDITYLQQGVITQAQIARNLEANETYQFEDGYIESLEDNSEVGEDLPEQEKMQQENLDYMAKFNQYVKDGMTAEQAVAALEIAQ